MNALYVSKEIINTKFKLYIFFSQLYSAVLNILFVNFRNAYVKFQVYNCFLFLYNVF